MHPLEVQHACIPQAALAIAGKGKGSSSSKSKGFRVSSKPELLLTIVDCGFEHPSEVQQKCIPQATLGTGMGRTKLGGSGASPTYGMQAVVHSEAKIFVWHGPQHLRDIAKKASEGKATTAEEEQIVASLMSRLVSLQAECAASAILRP